MFLKVSLFLVKECLVFLKKGGKLKEYIEFLKIGTDNYKIVKWKKEFIIHSFFPFPPSDKFKKHFKSFLYNRYLNRENSIYHTIISVTSRCPFGCFYCSAESFSKGDLDRNDLIKILEKLKKEGVSMVSFTGGEPLLVEYLPEVIEKFSEDFIFTIFTTGLGLNKERVKKFKESGLFGFAFSLDTYDRDEFNKIRGHNKAFDIALEGIKLSKEQGIYTMIHLVGTGDKANYNFLDRFFKFVKEIGVDEIRILEPLPCGNLISKPSEILSPEKLKVLIEIQKVSYSKKEYPKITSMPYIEHIWGCGAGNQHIYIDPKGNVHPCNFYTLSIGNLVNESFSVIKDRFKKLEEFKKSHSFICKSKEKIKCHLILKE